MLLGKNVGKFYKHLTTDANNKNQIVTNLIIWT